MKSILLIIAIIAGIGTSPAAMADTDDVVAGAAILLGTAAIFNRIRSGNDDAPQSPDERGEFQRGYRDGLNYAVFDVRGSTDDYHEGYMSGIDERNKRVDNHREVQTPRLPPEFSRACRVRAAEAFRVTAGDVQVVRTDIPSAARFFVEVRQARLFGNCQLNRLGDVVRYSEGHL
ncbi:MAG: hypothetical protein NTX73_04485 [Rhodobacterales bacterium]|nr:hypothetical protein [Rhodobacterales bacterium]